MSDIKESKPVTVEKAIPVTYDLGHLAVYDTNPIDPLEIGKDEQSKNDYLQSVTRDNVQLLINQILHQPLTKNSTTTNADSNETPITLVQLPDPIFQLPREKPVPKAKEPTKWELFARKKGIQKKGKTGKLVFDEEKQEWVNKWGYKGKNKELDNQWLVEVDEEKQAAGTPDELIDPRKLSRMERKKLVKKNELQHKRNLKEGK
ncbi:unnamed protein product [Ambrosiozyma monospora]|uniref:Ribosome biogenesis regulatory protein n=1 Tax=Ambrosiozyma monospora TaxID=43982 RepID=A0A9W6YVM4_AMBMO|nr:unnamed protein product [Ambrosiozyma monospora]